MTVVEIDCAEIVDWDSFHDSFSRAFGFPEFYGRNMNAWIDCLTSLDAPDGLTSIVCSPGEAVTIRMLNATSFRSRCPALYDALVECSAFVNTRRTESGAASVVELLFEG